MEVNPKNKDNLILQLTLDFSEKVLSLSQKLSDSRMYVLGNQLLRSGTSIGSNVWEAQSAESVKDFIHKLKIAAKECHETEYWLLLCRHLEPIASQSLISQLASVRKVLFKIISTSERRLNKSS